MRRFLSALRHLSDNTTADAVIQDIAALVVLSLFIFAASEGAAILGALVVAARLR